MTVPTKEEIAQERKSYDESVRTFKAAFAAFGQKAETGKFNGEDLNNHFAAVVAFAKAAADHHDFLKVLIEELLAIRNEEARDKKRKKR